MFLGSLAKAGTEHPSWRLLHPQSRRAELAAVCHHAMPGRVTAHTEMLSGMPITWLLPGLEEWGWPGGCCQHPALGASLAGTCLHAEQDHDAAIAAGACRPLFPCPVAGWSWWAPLQQLCLAAGLPLAGFGSMSHSPPSPALPKGSPDLLVTLNILPLLMNC